MLGPGTVPSIPLFIALIPRSIVGAHQHSFCSPIEPFSQPERNPPPTSLDILTQSDKPFVLEILHKEVIELGHALVSAESSILRQLIIIPACTRLCFWPGQEGAVSIDNFVFGVSRAVC